VTTTTRTRARTRTRECLQLKEVSLSPLAPGDRPVRIGRPSIDGKGS